jgi:glycosyltransferase involved in cell wall biosynthesis
MKVCFWGTRMDLLSGHARPAFELADQLIRMGHQVRIVTTRLSSAEAARHAALLKRQPHLARIQVERRFRSLGEMVLRLPSTRRHLADQLAWADLIHGFSLPSLSLVSRLVAFRVPLLLSLSSLPPVGLRESVRPSSTARLLLANHPGQLLAAAIVGRSWNRFDRIICWTEYLMREAIRQGVEPGRVHHLPIGLDLSRFVSTPPRPGKGPPTFLWLGWASPLRGVEMLVRAFLRALTRMPGARLVLADRGPNSGAAARLHASTMRRLQTGIRRAGIHASIEWSGFDANISSLLNACDVVVLPFPVAAGYSHPPLTLLEAMAHGKPVIATRIGSLPEYVEHGKEGLLVEPGNELALEEALIQLATVDRAEMGRRARERAARLPSWETIAERTVAVYEQALAAPAGPRPS